MNLDPTYLLWTTLLTLIISHFGAAYLVTVTPKSYWFWFGILNIIIGLLFL